MELKYTVSISGLMVDPQLGHIAIGVWAGAFEGLADKLETHFPDEEERRRFAKSVIRDVENPEYRLCTWV